MKTIFRCEYCDKLGTEDEIILHEETCIFNYTKRSCNTCKYAETPGFRYYKCIKGNDIPEGHLFSNCANYEWDEKPHTTRNPVMANNLFGGVF